MVYKRAQLQNFGEACSKLLGADYRAFLAQRKKLRDF